MPDIDDPDGAPRLVDKVEKAVGIDDDFSDCEVPVLSGVWSQRREPLQAGKRGFSSVEEAQGSGRILFAEIDEDGGVALGGAAVVAQLHRDDGKNLARSLA